MAATTMSNITIISHLIIAFLIASSVTSFAGVNGDGRAVSDEQREFDFFILALQWPGTLCQRVKKCCSQNGCCHKEENGPLQFTIHGLWPQYNVHGWPSCCSDSHFDMNQISTLSSDLEKYWPSYGCGSPSTCDGKRGTFWGHEWEKHGTCASSVLQDEYEFFRTALTIYFKYNVTEVLNEAGYVPSDSEKYPIGGIISAVQNAFHATPEITCSKDAINELHLCFYKNFQPRDCESSNKSCPEYVSLPVFSPPALTGLKTSATSTQFQPDNEVL